MSRSYRRCPSTSATRSSSGCVALMSIRFMQVSLTRRAGLTTRRGNGASNRLLACLCSVHVVTMSWRPGRPWATRQAYQRSSSSGGDDALDDGRRMRWTRGPASASRGVQLRYPVRIDPVVYIPEHCKSMLSTRRRQDVSRRECARPALRSSARQLAISRFGDACPGTVFMSPRVVAQNISCAPGGHGVPNVRFP